MANVSFIIEDIIRDAIQKFDGKYEYQIDNNFRKLLSLGELIDRLSIVNIKIFELQNEALESKDENFKAQAMDEDMKLALERSRLKICIDEKVLAYIAGFDKFNPETKNYKGI